MGNSKFRIHNEVSAENFNSDGSNNLDFTSVYNDIPSRPLYIPKHKVGNWYYAEDSLGRPYMIDFINQYNNRYSQDFESIDLPPESHSFHGKHIRIVVDDETPNAYLRIIDRYSCLCLNITEIKKKFYELKKQEDY